MPKFRKKPVEIEARLFDGSPATATPIIDWILAGDGSASYYCESDDSCRSLVHGLSIATLEGRMMASPGDYIIRGVSGEFYPCKPDIFVATYEPV